MKFFAELCTVTYAGFDPLGVSNTFLAIVTSSIRYRRYWRYRRYGVLIPDWVGFLSCAEVIIFNNHFEY
jgi:hypothetical protein